MLPMVLNYQIIYMYDLINLLKWITPLIREGKAHNLTSMVQIKGLRTNEASILIIKNNSLRYRSTALSSLWTLIEVQPKLVRFWCFGISYFPAKLVEKLIIHDPPKNQTHASSTIIQVIIIILIRVPFHDPLQE